MTFYLLNSMMLKSIVTWHILSNVWFEGNSLSCNENGKKFVHISSCECVYWVSCKQGTLWWNGQENTAFGPKSKWETCSRIQNRHLGNLEKIVALEKGELWPNEKLSISTNEYRHLSQWVLNFPKGQLISKGPFGILEFLQKTNERIRF